MRQRILAIDLGKNKSVSCDYDPQTGQHTFGALATTPADVHDVLAGHPGHLVVIEICPPAGWVSDVCQALGVALKMVNTASEEWSWKRVKGKSDRGDALKLAMMHAMGQHRYVHVPTLRRDKRRRGGGGAGGGVAGDLGAGGGALGAPPQTPPH